MFPFQRTYRIFIPCGNAGHTTTPQQSIKIIAEIVVNMNIVARKNISSKLKKSTSEIGYYSYTNR